MLQQLELITTGIHIDEVDDDHPTDVAKLELASDFDRRLTVGPQNGFARIGRSCERARVHIDHRECFGGLDDHVATGRQINPRLQRIADGGIDLVVLQQLAGFTVSLHQHIAGFGTKETAHTVHSGGIVHHNPGQIRAHVVPQNPMDEVFIAVEQHRRCSRFSGLLNRLPLAQQGFQILNQQLFADAVGFRTDQQTGSRRLDQNTKGTQSVPFCIRTDAPGDVDPLAMGLKHQVATWQSKISRQPWAFGAGRFFHHLNQNLLARLQKFSDPC